MANLLRREHIVAAEREGTVTAVTRRSFQATQVGLTGRPLLDCFGRDTLLSDVSLGQGADCGCRFGS